MIFRSGSGAMQGGHMAATPEVPGTEVRGGVAGAQELVGAVQRLSLARTVGEVQEIVRTTARRLIGADGATFVLRDGDRCSYVDEDAISPLWKGQRFPLTACISGWTMLNGRHTVIPDIYADARIPHDAYRPTFVKSLVMVPIRSQDPIGAIGGYWADHHAATDEEVALLQALADSASVAMESVKVWSELEDRVADRTAKLRAALGLNERLLHTLAHEVRNPLAATDGLLELVLDEAAGTLDRQLQADLEAARAAVADGLRIVTEQLDVAKDRAGELRVRLTAVDPTDVLGELGAMYRALRRNELVELVVDPAPGLPPLQTDRHLLAQVLRNLVGNALKFTDRGQVLVSARLAGEDAVVFAVTDTGIGIPDDQQARIFEEFAQVDDAQADRRAGTGLGLPFVQRTVEMLGGRVAVHSVPGSGSTFTVTLPLDPAA
jgi:signal transduction histidine kinase